MITYKQVGENLVQAFNNGRPTQYFISKSSSFYQIYAEMKDGYRYPVRGTSTHDKEYVKEDLATIIDKPAIKDRYSKIYVTTA